MPEPIHLLNLTLDELAAHFADWGLPAFRAKQVMKWVYEQHVADFDQMSNLSKRDRDLLAERMTVLAGTQVTQASATDGVEKLLIDWRQPQDAPTTGETQALATNALPILQPASQPGDTSTQTECVMIPSDIRKTACVSSQVGCAVGCRFCASGIGGLDGDLTAGRIVEQVWRLARLDAVGRISNVVFMGMGEPMANFNEVTKAVRILMAEWGPNISGRRITISTVGLPAQMRRLADLELPVTLAISLHAPNDAVRRQLIPWADYVTIEQLCDAGRYYFDRTGREITLEYILLRDVNDRPEHADQLADICHTLRCNVNLIRYNEVRGLPFSRPGSEEVNEFQATLQRRRVNVHIRASRGRDIAAACGQLRHEHAQTQA